MNVKIFLFPTVTVLALFVNNSIAHADNGLIYPPKNTSSFYQYPPLVSGVNRNNVTALPYVYGQNNIQRTQTFTPVTNGHYYRPSVVPQQTVINNVRTYAPPNNGRGAPANFTNYLPFSNTNMMPLSNVNNGFNPFSKGNIPFSNNSGGLMPANPMNNMFNNNQNFSVPFFNSNTNRKKAWGDKRNIWPDFYTDFTDEAWDTMMSSPRKLGRMPGGWRFPYISTPDPVTVSDAIVNQFPPIAEEAGNMADFSDWGIFDNK